MSRVGVMALQGGYGSHLKALAELGHEAVQVRTPADFAGLDGLVLPGGESSAQLKLIHRHQLEESLKQFAQSGKPMLVTCAGIILAAREVKHPSQPSFGWLDIVVSRNAWGRQIDSFEAHADIPQIESSFGEKPLPLIFIRAPRIIEIGSKARVLARFHQEPVLVGQSNVYGATFHPELTKDRRLHALIFGNGANENANRDDHYPRWRAVAAN